MPSKTLSILCMKNKPVIGSLKKEKLEIEQLAILDRLPNECFANNGASFVKAVEVKIIVQKLYLVGVALDGVDDHATVLDNQRFKLLCSFVVIR